MTNPLNLERVSDPLVSGVLALLTDAVNADLAEHMERAGIALDSEKPVQQAVPHPVDLRMGLAEQTLPVLAVYRVRERGESLVMGRDDTRVTLQATYICDATAREQLAERWPLLSFAAESIRQTMLRGSHSAHRGGEVVYEAMGVQIVYSRTWNKVEAYAEAGDYCYPMFRAEIEMNVRDARDMQPRPTLYPFHEIRTFINTASTPGTPRDVEAVTLTEAGEAALEEPFAEESNT